MNHIKTIVAAAAAMLVLNVFFGFYALVEPPDYTVAADTSSLEVDPGDTLSFNLILSPLRGFSSSVMVTVSGVPDKVEVTFDRNVTKLAGGENSTIRVDVKVDTDASAGLKEFIIEANSGGLLHRLTEKLNIIGGGRVLIEIREFWFWPDNITVRRGIAITWINRDQVGHTATSYEGVWDSKLLNYNQQYTYTFDRLGDYSYYCIPHPQMIGHIRVID